MAPSIEAMMAAPQQQQRHKLEEPADYPRWNTELIEALRARDLLPYVYVYV